jgi:hypothetical protein
MSLEPESRPINPSLFSVHLCVCSLETSPPQKHARLNIGIRSSPQEDGSCATCSLGKSEGGKEGLVFPLYVFRWWKRLRGILEPFSAQIQSQFDGEGEPLDAESVSPVISVSRRATRKSPIPRPLWETAPKRRPAENLLSVGDTSPPSWARAVSTPRINLLFQFMRGSTLSRSGTSRMAAIVHY